MYVYVHVCPTCIYSVDMCTYLVTSILYFALPLLSHVAWALAGLFRALVHGSCLALALTCHLSTAHLQAWHILWHLCALVHGSCLALALACHLSATQCLFHVLVHGSCLALALACRLSAARLQACVPLASFVVLNLEIGGECNIWNECIDGLQAIETTVGKSRLLKWKPWHIQSSLDWIHDTHLYKASTALVIITPILHVHQSRPMPPRTQIKFSTDFV